MSVTIKMKLFILPFGYVDEIAITEIIGNIATRIPFKTVRILARVPVPKCLNTTRNQYLGDPFLTEAKKFSENHNDKVLGITEVDLYTEGLNFIFGLAEIGGVAAVISIMRLKTADQQLYCARVLKEVVHELGHVLGLQHCRERRCVMMFSNSLADTDSKPDRFCHTCETRLSTLFRFRLH